MQANDFTSDLKKPPILHLNFNQDQDCFSIATEKGFKIFTSSPFKLSIERSLDGGIGYVEMLYRSNIFALIGGGNDPKKPLNRVVLWEDSHQKIMGELSFKSEVKSVKMRQKKFIVVLLSEIFVYNFADLKLDHHIETGLNPKGLCAVNNDVTNTMLASPDMKTGHVLIHLYDIKQKTTIKAHQSSLSFLELSPNGKRLATSSEKGMVIRIFNPTDGTQIQELRRGLEYAQIYSLSFDRSERYLAMSCDSGSIHIYNLKQTKQEKKEAEKEKELDNDSQEYHEKNAKNPTSKLKFLKFVMPFFDSEWSFAKFKVPSTRNIVAFGAESNTVIVISYSGRYYKAIFDPVEGGECKLIEEFNILEE